MQRKTAKTLKSSAESPGWTFLTNHMHILVVLAGEPDMRIRDLAEEVGITQRAVQRILAELTEAKILRVSKDGRRNRYTINRRTRLRHPLENRHTIGELLDLLGS